MVPGDENPLAQAPARSEEGEEIDRIMKEIEDLEKKMDGDEGQQEPRAAHSEEPAAPAGEASDMAETDANEGFESSKVVPMRQNHADTLAETDAVPARNEPLMRSAGDDAASGLSLKIGGCTEVNLDFSRAGIVVSLACTEEGLCITTNQGAEFRIPFKRSA